MEPYEADFEDEPTSEPGYRTFEVYQRERVGETTNLIKPRQLISDEYADDPYPLLEVLRENYPCYRDWLSNCFWITRYNDVTSVFADDQNFETRPKRWYFDSMDYGRDLWKYLPVQWAYERKIDKNIETVTEEAISSFEDTNIDLARNFAARIPLALWQKILNITLEQAQEFARLYLQMQRGARWNPQFRQKGSQSMQELTALLEPIFDQRRQDPEDDFISAVAQLELPEGLPNVKDLVVTILELDHETLHGGLSNLWFNLLTNPKEKEKVTNDHRLMKFAWLETLRYSAPVISSDRFARQEVERFGRLIPKGGLLRCSAASANRDPRQFDKPNAFIIGRKDLCQREPRGQYRADGLPSGIAFGLGKPSVHPAVPKGRPRSRYALIRDAAVTASLLLLEERPTLKIVDGEEPHLTCAQLGEMHACWELPAC
jgi:pulcherriminic acid synthase